LRSTIPPGLVPKSLMAPPSGEATSAAHACSPPANSAEGELHVCDSPTTATMSARGSGLSRSAAVAGARDTPSALGVEFSKFGLGTLEHLEQHAVDEDLRNGGFCG
jgi:hypothetical protein